MYEVNCYKPDTLCPHHPSKERNSCKASIKTSEVSAPPTILPTVIILSLFSMKLTRAKRSQNRSNLISRNPYLRACSPQLELQTQRGKSLTNSMGCTSNLLINVKLKMLALQILKISQTKVLSFFNKLEKSHQLLQVQKTEIIIK